MTSSDLGWFSDSRLTRVADSLASMVQVGVRLDTTPCHDSELALGQSRVGGYPDLPESFAWPMWKGRCLSFLAQLNMAELSSFPSLHELPGAGWLYFFYDDEQSTWGFDPNDRGSSLIAYVSEGSNIKRREYQSEYLVEGRYHPCRVTPREVPTPMPWESTRIRAL